MDPDSEDVVHLVQLLLPLRTQDGAPQPRDAFEAVERELIAYCGGVTTFSRAPAHGRWRDTEGQEQVDEIVVFEALVSRLDRKWWTDYRSQLALRFGQDVVVVRATAVRIL